MKRRKNGNDEISGMEILYDLIKNLVVSVIIVTLVFIFLFRPVVVMGSSMVPTLYDRERLVLNSLFYTPKAGDIVVMSNPQWTMLEETTIIKRVIAVEGDKVDIDFVSGDVFVNDVKKTESYINETIDSKPENALTFPQDVPKGYVFVMGDNRNFSADSRNLEIGMVDARYIIGKLVLRLYPFKADEF